MEKSYPRAGRPNGEGTSKDETSWLQRTMNEVGSLSWSPMAWIFLGLFGLAEVGNWQIGNEMTRVCELLDRADAAFSRPGPAQKEIEGICLNRSPKDFYKSR